MPCFTPLKGYRSKERNPSGKRSIVFNARLGFVDQPVDLPCNQCIGCRLERSRQWAIRCVHEAQLHTFNSFITLTYSPEHLPPNGSLLVSDFQKFMKRLRKRASGSSSDSLLLDSDSRIRFFHCGEYGEQNFRPHYHACLFGVDFADKVHWRTVNGHKYFISDTLNELWERKGHCTIGDVTFESAAYVARYITKKITGKKAGEHYQSMDPVTGEFVPMQPEYVTMSRRPGIAKGWYEKYKSDVFNYDLVVIRGKQMRPPRFYDLQHAAAHPDEFMVTKARREVRAEKFADDNTWERLKVRHFLKRRQGSLLKRSYENES